MSIETIQLKNAKGERALINKPDPEVLEGKRKPATEQEREDLANYKLFTGKLKFEPLSAEETAKEIAKEEEEAAKKAKKKGE